MDILICKMSLTKLHGNVATDILFNLQIFHPIHFVYFLIKAIGKERKEKNLLLSEGFKEISQARTMG